MGLLGDREITVDQGEADQVGDDDEFEPRRWVNELGQVRWQPRLRNQYAYAVWSRYSRRVVWFSTQSDRRPVTYRTRWRARAVAKRELHRRRKTNYVPEEETTR